MSLMSELIQNREDLIRYFESGAKPSEQWRVGSEYEKVMVRVKDGTALPFSGPNGVDALQGERAPITIEPGGQVELSGEQCENIHCAYREFTNHIQQLLELGHDL